MSCCYVLSNGRGQFKIGYTFGLAISRQWGCQVGSADSLRLVLVMPHLYPDVFERELHRAFWHKKYRGHSEVTGEWFVLEEDDFNQLTKMGFTSEKDKGFGYAHGNTSFDIRPLSGGQQHQTSDSGQDVPEPKSGFDHSRNQPVLLVSSRKY